MGNKIILGEKLIFLRWPQCRGRGGRVSALSFTFQLIKKVK